MCIILGKAMIQQVDTDSFYGAVKAINNMHIRSLWEYFLDYFYQLSQKGVALNYMSDTRNSTHQLF